MASFSYMLISSHLLSTYSVRYGAEGIAHINSSDLTNAHCGNYCYDSLLEVGKSVL